LDLPQHIVEGSLDGLRLSDANRRTAAARSTRDALDALWRAFADGESAAAASARGGSK